MPFKSKAQQRWMFSQHPAMAKRWADHTPDIKALPEHVEGSESDDHEKKGFSTMSAIAGLAKQAADNLLVEKLATDTQITPDLVQHLASMINMTPSAFVKLAYEDPAAYTIFLKLASGAIKPEQLTKGAASAGGMVSKVLEALKSRAGKIGTGVQNGLAGALNEPGVTGVRQGGIFGSSKPTGSLGKALYSTPLGGSVAGRTGTAGLGLGAAGAGINEGVKALEGGPESGAAGGAGGAGEALKGMAGGGPGAPKSPAAMNGPAPNPAEQGAAGGGGGGLSPAMKAGLGVAGVGAGALGVGALMRRRKKKEAYAMDIEFVKDVMRTALEKKAAQFVRQEAAKTLIGYLDKVASLMPIEKTASVRLLQSEVAAGTDLSFAIKKAYPHFNGEQRGILAYQLVEKAAKFKKGMSDHDSDDMGSGGRFPVKSRQEATCKPGEMGKTMAKMGSSNMTKEAKAIMMQIAKNKGLIGGAAGLSALGAGAGMLAKPSGPPKPPPPAAGPNLLQKAQTVGGALG